MKTLSTKVQRVYHKAHGGFMKKIQLFLAIMVLIQSKTLWAETCPDMSQSSSTPSGWYMIKQGTPLSSNNLFNGATWNLVFRDEIACLYNNTYPFTNAFQLVSLQNVNEPSQGAWQIVKARNPINDAGTCKSNEIANCPFTYSN